MLRIIDVNINRLREGLRVVEDIARFVLNDKRITERIKGIRHRIALIAPPISSLLKERNIDGDIGREIKDYKKEDLKGVLFSNIKRIEESLRVLEEFLGDGFRRIRYEVYSIEKDLIKPRMKGLYLIIDPLFCEPITIAEIAIKLGVKMLQLRDKRGNLREFLNLGEKIRALSDEITLIINDRLDVALSVNADGLHLGQSDLPIKYAKEKFYGIIGLSCHSITEAIKGEKEGADYISIGPIFKTKTKPELPPLGTPIIKALKEKINVPIVAIGGITLENISDLLDADAIAVLSAILESKDIEESILKFKEFLNNYPSFL